MRKVTGIYLRVRLFFEVRLFLEFKRLLVAYLGTC